MKGVVTSSDPSGICSVEPQSQQLRKGSKLIENLLVSQESLDSDAVDSGKRESAVKPHLGVSSKSTQKRQTECDQERSAVGNPQKVLRTRKVVKEEVAAEEANVDDLALNMPVEQYKPRPSRSRSVKVSIETAGNSKYVQETARKAKKKRSKTTDGNGLSDESVLLEMGFSNVEARKAMRDANGDIQSALDSLLSTRQSRATMQKEEQNPIVVLHQKDELSPLLPDERLAGDDRVDYGIPDNLDIAVKPAKGRGRPKRAPSALPDVISGERTVGADEMEVMQTQPAGKEEPQLAVKRLRGRPKKASKNAETVAAELGIGIEAVNPARIATSLSSLDPAMGQSEVITRPGNITGSVTGETAAPDPTQLDINPHIRKTPEKAERTPAGASKPHSPINKGKVPYKLGLSRRARVEPLLRIIKK